MRKSKKEDLPIITTDQDVNAHEHKQVLTEDQKKEFTRRRIESELEGNPNIPKRKQRKIRFASPDKLTAQRMKLLDGFGNPIAGYKWGTEKVKGTNLLEIIPDPNYKEKDSIDYNDIIIINPKYK